VSNVPKLIRKGHLTSRGVHERTLPSLDRAEVQQLAAERVLAAEVRTGSAQSRTRARRVTRRPPDNEHEWLRVTEAARLLGVTPTAVHQRARRDRLPTTMRDGLRWVRRGHLKQTEAARLVQRTRRP